MRACCRAAILLVLASVSSARLLLKIGNSKNSFHSTLSDVSVQQSVNKETGFSLTTCSYLIGDYVVKASYNSDGRRQQYQLLSKEPRRTSPSSVYNDCIRRYISSREKLLVEIGLLAMVLSNYASLLSLTGGVNGRRSLDMAVEAALRRTGISEDYRGEGDFDADTIWQLEESQEFMQNVLNGKLSRADDEAGSTFEVPSIFQIFLKGRPLSAPSYDVSKPLYRLQSDEAEYRDDELSFGRASKLPPHLEALESPR